MRQPSGFAAGSGDSFATDFDLLNTKYARPLGSMTLPPVRSARPSAMSMCCATAERVRNFTFSSGLQIGKRSLFDVMSAERPLQPEISYVNALYDGYQATAHCVPWARA